ncbi:hypothetical protein ACFQ0M_01515 [Kitasatospora aburaviensis]
MTPTAVPSPPEDVAVVLSGYGPVGRAYADLLRTRGDELAHRHGVRLWLGAVRTGSAHCLPRPGGPLPPRPAWGPPVALEESLDRSGARVLVQALPSSPAVRRQAAEEAVLALRRGVHVVTAAKGTCSPTGPNSARPHRPAAA